MLFCTNCGTKVEGRFCPSCGYDCNPDESVAVAVITSKSVASSGANEALEQLYALRAGLSYISEKRDEYEKNVEGVVGARVKRLEDDINRGRRAVIDKEKELKKEELDASLAPDINKFERLKKELIKEEAALAKQEKTYGILRSIDEYFDITFHRTKIRSGIVCGVLGLCAAPAAVFAMSAPLGAKVFYGILIGAVIGGLLFGLSFLVNAMISGTAGDIAMLVDKKIAKKEKLVRELAKQVSEAETSLSAPGRVDRIKKDIVNIKSSIASDEKSLTIARAELKHKKEDYSAVTSAFFAGLIKGYSKVLDTRDWENLDLVIYYLETGRADNIKEALQQVDRQRQNDKLVGALGIATDQVCMTISSGMRQMTNVMLDCTRVITDSLSDIRREQANLSSRVEHYAGVTESAISHALREKADTSSRQMMEDVHYMRELAETVERRQRYSVS